MRPSFSAPGYVGAGIPTLLSHCRANVRRSCALEVEGGGRPQPARRLQPGDEHLVAVLDARAGRVEGHQQGWRERERCERVEGSWRCCPRGRVRGPQHFRASHTTPRTTCPTDMPCSTEKYSKSARHLLRTRRAGQHRQGHQRRGVPRSSCRAAPRRNCGAAGPAGATRRSVSACATTSSAGVCSLRRTAGPRPSCPPCLRRSEGPQCPLTHAFP